MRERKRELVGRVVSDKMEKTVVVAVQTLRRHRLYQRTVRRTKKFMAHNDNNQAHSGDLVRIKVAAHPAPQALAGDVHPGGLRRPGAGRPRRTSPRPRCRTGSRRDRAGRGHR